MNRGPSERVHVSGFIIYSCVPGILYTIIPQIMPYGISITNNMSICLYSLVEEFLPFSVIISMQRY